MAGAGCKELLKKMGNRDWTDPRHELNPFPIKRKKVLIIAGPTAVGKTRLSLTIAQAIGGEIVSADSMQVYRGMDIGTAKATLEERQRVPHHLIDSLDLDDVFNVVEFYKSAHEAMQEIFAKGAVPIIVGGTGFYIHSLIYGPPPGPPAQPELREKLEGEMEKRGAEMLYDWVKTKDPVYAATITQRDRHKIIRAIEIMMVTGQRVSDLPPSPQGHLDLCDFRCWFIHLPKETLYARIDARCDQMIAQGFLDEVKQLEKEGLKENRTACQAIGYRQALDYLKSEQTASDWDRFVVAFKQASRHYAKRQFTWFRKEPLFRWLDMSNLSIDQVTEMIIQDFESG